MKTNLWQMLQTFETSRYNSAMTYSAVVYRSTSYEIAETKLHDVRRLCGPMKSPPRVGCTLKPFDSIYFSTLRDVEAFMLSKVSGNSILMENLAPRSWRDTFNAAVGLINKPDTDRGNNCYKLTNGLLTLNIAKGKSRDKFSMRRVLWIGGEGYSVQ